MVQMIRTTQRADIAPSQNNWKRGNYLVDIEYNVPALWTKNLERTGFLDTLKCNFNRSPRVREGRIEKKSSMLRPTFRLIIFLTMFVSKVLRLIFSNGKPRLLFLAEYDGTSRYAKPLDSMNSFLVKLFCTDSILLMSHFKVGREYSCSTLHYRSNIGNICF